MYVDNGSLQDSMQLTDLQDLLQTSNDCNHQLIKKSLY